MGLMSNRLSYVLNRSDTFLDVAMGTLEDIFTNSSPKYPKSPISL